MNLLSYLTSQLLHLVKILRERSPERLKPWLTRAVRSQLGALVGFALRLGEDYEAVKAGMTLALFCHSPETFAISEF